MNALFSLLVPFYRREGFSLIDCTYTPQSAMHCEQRFVLLQPVPCIIWL